MASPAYSISTGMPEPGNIYRPCVAAIIEDSEGCVLIGERSDIPNAWQFPQGGLEHGESAERGLVRELREELSLERSAYCISDSKGPYRYLFPEGRTKKGFRGQEQFYFRLRLIAAKSAINVDTSHPEFGAVRWIEPAEFSLEWLPEMKHEVYRSVFMDFFGLPIR